ncbi:MAG: DUF4064 domain-containing protein [Galactobacter sp.]
MARGAVRTGTPLWRNPILLLTLTAVAFTVQALASLGLGLIGPQALRGSRTIHIGNTMHMSLDSSTEVGRLANILTIGVLAAGVIGVVLMIVGKKRAPAWGIAYLFGLPLLGLGLGSFLAYREEGTFQSVSLIMAGVGLVVCLLHPMAELRHRVFLRRQETTRANGVTTNAQVKRVGMSNYNHVDYWVSWLQYQDGQGRTFHIKHRQMVAATRKPTVCQNIRIAYDPQHPGRRSSVVVMSNESNKVDRFSARQRSGSSGTAPASHPSPGSPTGSSTKFVNWKGPR